MTHSPKIIFLNVLTAKNENKRPCVDLFSSFVFFCFFSSRKKMRTCTKKCIIRYFVWMLAQINVFVTFRIMQFDLRTFVFFSGLFLPLWIDYGTGLITASRGKTFPIPFKWTFKFFCPALHVDCVRTKEVILFFFFFYRENNKFIDRIYYFIFFKKFCTQMIQNERVERNIHDGLAGTP